MRWSRRNARAGRRMLCAFDFPFGYPQGFARKVTGAQDPFALWDWFEAHVTDARDGTNNRFEVAEKLNAMFAGAGPFWGKSHRDRWPGVPYRKEGIAFDVVAEKRACDTVAKAASSCFQMYFPPTVGGQVMMGLPMLNRLRRMDGVRVWPLEPWAGCGCRAGRSLARPDRAGGEDWGRARTRSATVRRSDCWRMRWRGCPESGWRPIWPMCRLSQRRRPGSSVPGCLTS